MNWKRRICILIFVLASSSLFASVSGICFVYQPLTTMGTDQDPQIIVAKVPVIASGANEHVVTYISAPNRLPQAGPQIIEDSNLLSALGISITGEWIEKPDHYVATLDLSKMKQVTDYEFKEEDVVKATVKCIQGTIDELGERKTWKIKIIAKPEDGAKWKKYETDYRPKAKARN
jgi:hypothetical protein